MFQIQQFWFFVDIFWQIKISNGKIIDLRYLLHLYNVLKFIDDATLLKSEMKLGIVASGIIPALKGGGSRTTGPGLQGQHVKFQSSLTV
jgi:hypothetical protein